MSARSAGTYNVVVTGILPSGPVEALAREMAVIRTGGAPPGASELADADAVIPILRHRIGPSELAAAPRLRVVANYAVGYDNVDVTAASARGIAVCNTPDVLTDATADLTWALLLAAARNLVAGDALVRSGNWHGWEPTQLLGVPIAGRTLGIVGLGRIGRAVARRSEGFEMQVTYFDRKAPAPDAGGAPVIPSHWRASSLPDLLAESDVVSVHVPLDDGTRGLIGPQELGRMRADAILVNTARGGIVDELALANALRAGALGAAALDVFDGEPAVRPELRTAPRLVLAPHIGSATGAARVAMAQLCCDAVRSVLIDERIPANCVNAKALGRS